MGKRLEWTLHKENHQMAKNPQEPPNQLYEKVLNFFNHPGNATVYHHTPTRMAKKKKASSSQLRLVRMWSKVRFPTLLGQVYIGTRIWGNCQCLINLNICVSYYPAVSLLVISPVERHSSMESPNNMY